MCLGKAHIGYQSVLTIGLFTDRYPQAFPQTRGSAIGYNQQTSVQLNIAGAL